MRVSLFRDIPEEKLYSMEGYADELAKHLRLVATEAQKSSPLELKEVTVHKTGFIRPTRILLRHLPVLKYYVNDLYFSRYVLYPPRARFSQGEVNHVVDNSYGFLVNSLDPTKTVVTCHDLIGLTYETGEVERKVFRHALAGMVKAKKIIAVSKRTKKRILEEFPISEEKVTVVYSGVDEEFDRVTNPFELERVKEKYHLPTGFLILNVGSTLRYKNIEGLLTAFSAFLKLAPEAWLVKAGGEFTKEQQVLISQLGIGQKIRSLGFVPEKDLVTLFSSVNVLASPSWEEGFGWTPLEAAACGCPVVVSDRCGLAEVPSGGAEVINPENTEEIVQAIAKIKTKLARNEFDRSRLIDTARKFSWHDCARQTLEVYQEVYKSNTRRV
ncbi:MAG: glycosyltransferase family 1 protein [bacterium]|nr:glycosyltransferase family 1 protein [bacterium]